MFKPTYLYIKQHLITGKLYFGKTTQKDPVKYKGSGSYWKNHLKCHGDKVVTLWYELFTDKDELVKFATTFSDEMNIVESQSWANQQTENGLDVRLGVKFSTETIQKLSDSHKGRKHSDETKQKMSQIAKGRTLSDEAKKKISEANKNRIVSDETRAKQAEKAKGNKRHMMPHSDEAKKKISAARCGVSRSEDAKNKISMAMKGKPKPIISCPHCGQTGGASQMKRWHFDNCKEYTQCTH